MKSVIFAVYSSSTFLINLLISEVSILSLYSESGISKIFLICSRSSLAFFSSSVSCLSSSEVFSLSHFFSSVFLSDLDSFLVPSSVQKTLSNIESIQLFFLGFWAVSVWLSFWAISWFWVIFSAVFSVVVAGWLALFSWELDEICWFEFDCSSWVFSGFGCHSWVAAVWFDSLAFESEFFFSSALAGWGAFNGPKSKSKNHGLFCFCSGFALLACSGCAWVVCACSLWVCCPVWTCCSLCHCACVSWVWAWVSWAGVWRFWYWGWAFCSLFWLEAEFCCKSFELQKSRSKNQSFFVKLWSTKPPSEMIFV